MGFSWDEDTVKAFVVLASDHPDLRPESDQGRTVLRGLERDARRKALVNAQRIATGGFRISEEMGRCFDVVFRKTVRGLYYGNYRKLVPMTNFHLISIEDARTTTRDQVVDRLRPRVRDITEQPLPAITASSRSRIFVVESNALPINPAEKPIRLRKVFQFFRDEPVRWEPYQPGIFTFGFVQVQGAAAACVMELWNTLIIAVSAPWPGMQGPFRKGRKSPFPREQ